MTDVIEVDKSLRLRKEVIEFRGRYPIRTWLLMWLSRSLHKAEAKRRGVQMSKLKIRWGSNENL